MMVLVPSWLHPLLVFWVLVYLFPAKPSRYPRHYSLSMADAPTLPVYRLTLQHPICDDQDILGSVTLFMQVALFLLPPHFAWASTSATFFSSSCCVASVSIFVSCIWLPVSLQSLSVLWLTCQDALHPLADCFFNLTWMYCMVPIADFIFS